MSERTGQTGGQGSLSASLRVVRGWLDGDHEEHVMTLVEDGSFVDYIRQAVDAFAAFYDAVDAAQKIDNTGGDSAVSVTLWSWAEARDVLR